MNEKMRELSAAAKALVEFKAENDIYDRSAGMDTNRSVVIYADGACNPRNPGGYATYGWVAQAGGRQIESGMGCVAKGDGATNNVAEFGGVIAALTWAERQGLQGVTLYTDSQLVVDLVSGKRRCHKLHLQPLQAEARAKLLAVQGTIEWIPGEQNTLADKLSKLAYQRALADPTWTTDRVAPVEREQPAYAGVSNANPPDPNPDLPDITCPRCHMSFRLFVAIWQGLISQADCAFCPYCGGEMGD